MKYLSKRLISIVMLASIITSCAKPINTEAYGKDKTVKMLGNAHIDAAWQWRVEETIRECETTFTRAIENLEKNPDFRFSQSQAQLYAWTEEYYPELFKKIQDKVKEGNWEVTGGQWVEPDLNIPNGESLVRQSLYGQNYFDEKLGVKSTISWLPDVFGFGYNVPQILKKSGMNDFITAKLNWNDTNKWPHEVFNWQSPDGSSVLAYKTVYNYQWSGSELNNKDVYDRFLEQPASRGMNNALTLYGAGDHGGGPNQSDIDAIRNVNAKEDAPNVEMSMAEDAFNILRNDIESNKDAEVPTVNDEMYNEFHRGVYTTSGMMKKYNRMCEILAEESEKYASLSYLLGGIDYPKEKIEEAWKMIALNQFHDILPGSSILGVYIDAFNDAEIALNLLNSVKEEAIQQIISRIDTNGNGIPLVIFNPLSWDRNEYIEKIINFETEVDDVEIKDSNGNVVESQVLSKNGKNAKVLIKASVPATGYSVYTAEVKENTYKVEDEVIVDEKNYTMENKFFKVTINPENGNISSIIDKINGNREVLEEGKEANELNILEDTPKQYEAWDVDMDDMNVEATVINGLKEIKLIENTKSKATFRVSREWGDSKFASNITLYSDEDRIDIKTDVEWNEFRKLLKASFPLSVTPEKATYEVAYGSVQRDTSWENRTTGAQFEVSGQKWADMTDGDYGVSILNDSKYGWDTLDNRIRLTLLKAASDNGGLTDRNQNHEINYSIYPHSGNWSEANTVQEAFEFNYKMDTIQTTAHDGDFEKSKSFAKSENDNIIISTIKKAEKDSDIVVRLYESEGKEGSVGRIVLPSEIESIEEVNLLEEPVNDNSNIVVDGNEFETTFNKHEIKTFKIKFKDVVGYKDTKIKSYPINLIDSYNLDGISSDANRLDGDYSGMNESISAELLPENIKSNGIEYIFGPKKDGEKNIIKAEGQSIKLPNEKHDAIYMLGNSAGIGKSDGKFVVNYTDGTSTEKVLTFTGWQELVGGFLDTYVNNTIGLRLTHTHKSGENTLDIDNNMYMYEIKLDNSKVVESIELPNSEGIRIAAISYADGVTETIKDTEAPEKVDNFEAVTPYKKYSSYVDLKWDEAMDNKAVKRYRVYRAMKPDMSDEQLIARTNNTEYRDVNVSSPERYFYRVEAQDEAGNIGESSEIKTALAGANIALGCNVEVDGQMNSNEAGILAVDGNLDTKWCFTDGTNNPHWISIDLGDIKEINGVNIHHAGAGGEHAEWNTRDYKILISNDNKTWEVYEENKGNDLSVTKHNKEAKARYVKLVVDKPTQSDNTATRIYEIEVLSKGTNDIIDNAPENASKITSIERGYKSLKVNYDKVEGADLYKILYGTTDNSEEMEVVDNIVGNSFVLNDIEPGKTYYFKVIGKNYYGEGPTSDIASIRILNEKNFTNDLSQYFNLDGIASGTGNKADGVFDNINWLYDGDFITDPIKFGDLEFKMGSKVDGEKNLVNAKGQEILLNEGKASSIYVLAAAHHGNESGNFIVNYTDGTSTEKNLKITDWVTPSRDDFSEVLVLKSKHRLYNGGDNPENASIDNKETYINMYPIDVDSNKIVKSITLPNNGNINIFAITTGLVNENIIIEKPSNLKAISSSKAVDLTWNDPINTFGLEEYIIYKDGKEVSTVPFGENKITIEGLKENTIYGFKVVAKFSNGEKSKPVSVNIRTTK